MSSPEEALYDYNEGFYMRRKRNIFLSIEPIKRRGIILIPARITSVLIGLLMRIESLSVVYRVTRYRLAPFYPITNYNLLTSLKRFFFMGTSSKLYLATRVEETFFIYILRRLRERNKMCENRKIGSAI